MLKEKDLIRFYREVVDRLVLQYKEYLFLSDLIKKLEDKRFVTIAQIARAKNLSVSDVVKQENRHDELGYINDLIALYKTDLQRVSDEMTFPNPLVWMMYKDKAYKGTSSEIATLGDFRKHCSPSGYICTNRFKFLSKYLLDNNEMDISDAITYPDRTKLSDFYLDKEILKLSGDSMFMTEWKKNEYLITDNKINKWKNISI